MRCAGGRVKTDRIVIVISYGYGKSVTTGRCETIASIWQIGIGLVWPWSGWLVWPDGGRLVWPESGRLVPPRYPVTRPLDMVVRSRTVYRRR